MIYSGKLIEKLLFVVIYTVLAVIIIWGASRIGDYAADMAFYNDFLLPWESALTVMRSNSGIEPACPSVDPLDCMPDLFAHMQKVGIAPPRSNTDRANLYRLGRFGGPTRSILLLYHQGRITLFGLPVTTFDHLDRFIDGKTGPQEGAFSGVWSSDRLTRIGHWRI